MRLDYLLPALSLIIFFTVLIILMVMYVEPPIPDSSGGIAVCPVGVCSVHRLSGKKTCSSDELVEIFIVKEVCASRTACDTKTNPFAVQPNGGTLPASDPDSSFCADGAQCACVGLEQCSENTATFWTFENNNQVAIQKDSYTISASDPKDLTPMSIPQGSVCTINRYVYDRQAFWPSKCIRGYLAFWTADGTVLPDSPVGCFFAKNMEEFNDSQILVYDESTERFLNTE